MTKVNEEKLLNEIFVTLEYSDSFREFVENMSEEAREALHTAIHGVFDDSAGMDQVAPKRKPKR